MKTALFAAVLAAVLLLATAGTTAQTIYTTVDIDGHRTFSDRPGTTAELQAEAAPATEAPKPAIRRMIGSQHAASINAKEAERRLAKAQRARARGMEPEAGELTKEAGARTVTYRYWQRQIRLRQAVEQAQRRSEETLRPQLAAR